MKKNVNTGNPTKVCVFFIVTKRIVFYDDRGADLHKIWFLISGTIGALVAMIERLDGGYLIISFFKFFKRNNVYRWE